MLITLDSILNTDDNTIVCGKRQTGKTQLAAKFIESVYSPEAKILYVSFNQRATNLFKNRLPNDIVENIEFTNYEKDSTVDDYVRGQEYDFVVFDSYFAVPRSNIDTVLTSIKSRNGRVILLLDEEKSADSDAYFMKEFKSVYVL